MLYVDLPTRAEFLRLFQKRADACVSIYVETTPVTRETEKSRIDLGNLVREARHQLEAAHFDKRRLEALLQPIQDIAEDDDAWRYQANSLAIFATPDSLITYRLANRLSSMVQVADRFHLKPLLRAVAFPHSAFVLALSENAIRLVEMHADIPAVEVKVPGMPTDAASLFRKSTLNDRSPKRRIEASEGQNLRLGAYAREVNAALRPLFTGMETPLILAATAPLADIYPHSNTYPHLVEDGIRDSPDHLSDGELAERARPLLDRHHAKMLADVNALYAQRAGDRRTTTDLSDAARAATFGAIATLMIDIDSVIPGFVDEETGAITRVEKDDAHAYDIVDEIAGRAFMSGANVIGVRRDDLPETGDLAAILRYPL